MRRWTPTTASMRQEVRARRHPSTLINIIGAAAVAFSLLAACLQAKHHGSHNIYIGVHFIVSEERRQLRAVFLFFFPSGVGRDGDRPPRKTVGFSPIGLKS